MTHSNMCSTSWLPPSLRPLLSHTHSQAHIGKHSVQITDTLLYLYKGMFYFLPSNPLFFSSYRSKIQTHSRCADHISQLDTLTPTLEFSLEHTLLTLLYMSTGCNELKNKYPVPSRRKQNHMFMTQTQMWTDIHT